VEPSVTELRGAELTAAFEAELASALVGTGLEIHLGHRMPWVQKPGASDGYWVSLVLQNWPGHEEHGRTAMFVSYVSDDTAPGRIHSLNFEAFIRDPELLARLVVAAIQADQGRKATAERRGAR
jgi:hypothetical protein